MHGNLEYFYRQYRRDLICDLEKSSYTQNKKYYTIYTNIRIGTIGLWSFGYSYVRKESLSITLLIICM